MWKSQRLDGGCAYISGIEIARKLIMWRTRVFTWSISGVKEVWIKPLQPKPDVINAPFIIYLMWSILGVKEVWIKPLQPKPDVINAPFIIYSMCDIFLGVYFNKNYGISNKWNSSSRWKGFMEVRFKFYKLKKLMFISMQKIQMGRCMWTKTWIILYPKIYISKRRR
jgi:hypothetical protein